MKLRTHLNWQRLLQTPLYAIILFIYFFLAGCSTVTKDGPPPYDVDVSRIPNAQPKVEKLSKYGNMPVYRVNGKNYYVMNSSKNYEAEGTASWYGTKFHKHNTSSGEKYDMLSMTAAHRTLPLPTYLQVTNETNGRTVIVKVNDRGPFADNRLLDLSYAAAKKLGMIGHGTAYVKVKAIDPTEYQNKEDIHTNSFYIVNNKNHTDVQRELANHDMYNNSSDAPSELAQSTYVNPILTEKTHKAFKAKQIQYAKNKTHTLQSKQLASNPSKSNKTYKTNTQSKQLASSQSSHNKQLASNQSSHNKHVYLQVGAFSNKLHAEKLKKQLSPMVASSIQITEHGSPKKLYRVQIGPIKDSMTVARINKQLKSIGLNSKILFT